MKIKEKFLATSQYLAPHSLISKLFNCFSNSKVPFLKDWMISRFMKHYNVDLKEAETENPLAYESFNMFFTRTLKDTARPIDKNNTCMVCPADGIISQFGRVDSGRIFQAKNYNYSLAELLGGSHERTKPFLDGNFITIYISPRDYHRVHMPANGILREMVCIPGRLFSVNPMTVESIPNLFTRNRRIVCIFDTEYGPMAIILIGAMIVSSIETAWKSNVSLIKNSIYSTYYDQKKSIYLEKGQEMGHFRIGSTVIVVYGSYINFCWLKTISTGKSIRMGEKLAFFSQENN